MKKNDENINPIRKQSALIFTIFVCIAVLLVAAIVSSGSLLKGTYAGCTYVGGQMQCDEGSSAGNTGGLDVVTPSGGDGGGGSTTSTQTYEDGSKSVTTTYSDGSTTRQNYDTDGTTLLSTVTTAGGDIHTGTTTSITRNNNNSALPTLTTQYYSDSSSDGFGTYRNYDSYKQIIDYSSITRNDLNKYNNATVEKNYVKTTTTSSTTSTSGGTTTTSSTTKSTDVLASTVTKTPTSGSNYTMKVVVNDENQSALIDATRVLYYTNESECESDRGDCNKIGSLYVSKEDAQAVLFNDRAYCQQITGTNCGEKRSSACPVEYTMEQCRAAGYIAWSACNCEDGCIEAPAQKTSGSGCDSVGGECEINGGTGSIVESGGNCVCSGGGGSTPSGGSPSTPINYCVYNCEPGSPDTPIYIEPGRVVYPTTSCWSCMANDGSGAKYIHANSFIDAANGTAGNYCKVVESDKCNNAPTVDSSGSYCWSCIKDNKKVYTKANLASTAMTITGGDSCTIVSMNLCTTSSGSTTPTSGSTSSGTTTGETYCWSCKANGKNVYAKAKSSSSAETITKGTSCSIVNMSLCNTKTEENVVVNPKTGMIAIIVAWIVGIMTITYALWYFRKTNMLKNK